MQQLKQNMLSAINYFKRKKLVAMKPVKQLMLHTYLQQLAEKQMRLMIANFFSPKLSHIVADWPKPRNYSQPNFTEET